MKLKSALSLTILVLSVASCTTNASPVDIQDDYQVQNIGPGSADIVIHTGFTMKITYETSNVYVVLKNESDMINKFRKPMTIEKLQNGVITDVVKDEYG